MMCCSQALPGVNKDAEAVVKRFWAEKMKVAKEAVGEMVMERVHRIGPKQHGRCRKIVAKFLQFKDKGFVRKKWKTLERTPFYVSEQFPQRSDRVEKTVSPETTSGVTETETCLDRLRHVICRRKSGESIAGSGG